jgi:hypothetical protein
MGWGGLDDLVSGLVASTLGLMIEGGSILLEVIDIYYSLGKLG